MKFSIIVAADINLGIGKDNKLPWHLPGDMKYFAEVTSDAAEGKQNALIMGRKTWESIPAAHRPLKARLNVVLSRGDVELPEGVLLEHSFEDALKMLDGRDDVGKVFIIGGANVFEQAINHPDCEKIYITEVVGEFECDVFFPMPPDGVFEEKSVSETHKDEGGEYRFSVYERAS